MLLLQELRPVGRAPGQELVRCLFVGVEGSAQGGDSGRIATKLCGCFLDLVLDGPYPDDSCQRPCEKGHQHQCEGPGPFGLEAPALLLGLGRGGHNNSPGTGFTGTGAVVGLAVRRAVERRRAGPGGVAAEM